MGGVCSMSPTKVPSASATFGSVRPSVGRVAMVRRAASCVSVVWPKRTVASYSFSRSEMKLATLVASPMQMGSTPVAVGSSVPVWPARFDLNSPRTRRTTSKLVGPLGLSTTTTPERSLLAIQRLLDLLGDARPHRRLAPLDAAARRVVLPAAAGLLRAGRHRHPAARAERDAPGPALRRLPEAGRHLDAVDAARVVDETVGQVHRALRPRHHLVGDGDGGELAVHFQRAEHLGQQAHARQRLLLVDPHRHLPGIDARLEQLGGDAEALRVRARVTEGTGVGEDAGVEALGGLAADGVAQALEDL